MTATLFGLALLTYAARIYIRSFVLKEFFAEDGLLLFAVICLCIVTGLDLSDTHHLYDSVAVIFQGPDSMLLINIVTSALWWCVIFPAKLAFLFFFRRLILHLPRLYMWWWCALAIMLLSWAASTVADVLRGPYVTTQQGLCR